MHSSLMEKLFGFRPTSFRNTELLYDNDIAKEVKEMGFNIMLCGQNPGSTLEDKVYLAQGTNGKLFVLPLNRRLSDSVGFKFPERITAPEFAGRLATIGDECVMIANDIETIGHHNKKKSGIYDFWSYFPEAMKQFTYDGKPKIVMATPSDVAGIFEDVSDRPILDINNRRISWGPDNNDRAWVGTNNQVEFLANIEVMGDYVRDNPGLLEFWRQLTTSDNLYYLCDDPECQSFNPFRDEGAAQVLTNRINNLIERISDEAAGQTIHKLEINQF